MTKESSVHKDLCLMWQLTTYVDTAVVEHDMCRPTPFT